MGLICACRSDETTLQEVPKLKFKRELFFD